MSELYGKWMISIKLLFKNEFYFLKKKKSRKVEPEWELGLSTSPFLKSQNVYDGHSCPKSGAILKPSGPQREERNASTQA